MNLNDDLIPGVVGWWYAVMFAAAVPGIAYIFVDIFTAHLGESHAGRRKTKRRLLTASVVIAILGTLAVFAGTAVAFFSRTTY